MIKLFAIGISVLLAACAGRVTQLPPEPPKYVEQDIDRQVSSMNSLWSGKSNLFVDAKARGLNDLVTILIVENATAKKKAGTKTGRESSMEAGVSALFGTFLDKLDRNTFSPAVSASTKNDFKGIGETTREGLLQATITARVVEVLPNGNLIVESRKEITVNRERQILILKGRIRPEDINGNNTIMSTYVADAKIFYTGAGVVNDKQGQGWLVRAMDKVWPF